MATNEQGPVGSQVRKIDEEIRNGLPCEWPRIQAAQRSLDFYYLRNLRWLERREAESSSDFRARPKVAMPFTRRVVDLLCSKLYCPGPNRSYQGEDAKGYVTKWMDGVYTDCLVNSLWQHADRMSTLHGVAAFQVAATGDERRPLKIRVWDRSSFWFVPDADDADKLEHVVTIDRVDDRTRYTWWTAGRIRTYVAEGPKGPGLTGRAAKFVSQESNPYGRVPFSLVHHTLPTGGLDTPGLGDFLCDFNANLDAQASDMAGAVEAYHAPLGIAYDVAPETNVIKIMGRFVRVPRDPLDLEGGINPRLEYLQADLDIPGGWENIRSAIRTTLDGLGLPEALYAMAADTMLSGAALIAEQIPLVDASKARQEPFRVYERNLAALCLAIGGMWYEDEQLTRAAQDLDMALTWPPEVVNVPGAERDQQDRNSLELGLESVVDVKMRRSGLTRDRAIAELERVRQDNLMLAGPAAGRGQQSEGGYQ